MWKPLFGLESFAVKMVLLAYLVAYVNGSALGGLKLFDHGYWGDDGTMIMVSENTHLVSEPGLKLGSLSIKVLQAKTLTIDAAAIDGEFHTLEIVIDEGAQFYVTGHQCLWMFLDYGSFVNNGLVAFQGISWAVSADPFTNNGTIIILTKGVCEPNVISFYTHQGSWVNNGNILVQGYGYEDVVEFYPNYRQPALNNGDMWFSDVQVMALGIDGDGCIHLQGNSIMQARHGMGGQTVQFSPGSTATLSTTVNLTIRGFGQGMKITCSYGVLRVEYNDPSITVYTIDPVDYSPLGVGIFTPLVFDIGSGYNPDFFEVKNQNSNITDRPDLFALVYNGPVPPKATSNARCGAHPPGLSQVSSVALTITPTSSSSALEATSPKSYFASSNASYSGLVEAISATETGAPNSLHTSIVDVETGSDKGDIATALSHPVQFESLSSTVTYDSSSRSGSVNWTHGSILLLELTMTSQYSDALANILEPTPITDNGSLYSNYSGKVEAIGGSDESEYTTMYSETAFSGISWAVPSSQVYEPSLSENGEFSSSSNLVSAASLSRENHENASTYLLKSVSTTHNTSIYSGTVEWISSSGDVNYFTSLLAFPESSWALNSLEASNISWSGNSVWYSHSWLQETTTSQDSQLPVMHTLELVLTTNGLVYSNFTEIEETVVGSEEGGYVTSFTHPVHLSSAVVLPSWSVLANWTYSTIGSEGRKSFDYTSSSEKHSFDSISTTPILNSTVVLEVTNAWSFTETLSLSRNMSRVTASDTQLEEISPWLLETANVSLACLTSATYTPSSNTRVMQTSAPAILDGNGTIELILNASTPLQVSQTVSLRASSVSLASTFITETEASPSSFVEVTNFNSTKDIWPASEFGASGNVEAIEADSSIATSDSRMTVASDRKDILPSSASIEVKSSKFGAPSHALASSLTLLTGTTHPLVERPGTMCDTLATQTGTVLDGINIPFLAADIFTDENELGLFGDSTSQLFVSGDSLPGDDTLQGGHALVQAGEEVGPYRVSNTEVHVQVEHSEPFKVLGEQKSVSGPEQIVIQLDLVSSAFSASHTTVHVPASVAIPLSADASHIHGFVVGVLSVFVSILFF